MNFYIETLGCPKNFNDSQVAGGILENAGHKIVNSLEVADAILVNTCGFINDAKVESIDKILEMTSMEDKLLIVSGCLAQRYGDELYDELPEVDIFIGVNEYHNLPNIINDYKKGTRVKRISLYEKEFETANRKLAENEFSATVKISEGCDNHCTYCIIPKIRGKYRSRAMDDIIREAKSLASKGIKEIILVGQDVTNYGIDLYSKYSLDILLKELVKIDELKWIRLMYCYEDRITDELIKVMAEEEKVCKYIDIPLQHSSDAVLKAMRRHSTSDSIRNTIYKLRKAIPDIAIRTTFIVGFPGETDEDFDNLYEFAKNMRFDRLGVFSYSQEEDTPAAKMKYQIDDEIKDARKDAIMNMQMSIANEKNQKFIGREIEVVVEYKEDANVYVGRSQYDAPEIDNSVIISSKRELKPGDFITVKIYDAYDYDILGREI